eukprot:s6273_g2.t1
MNTIRIRNGLRSRLLLIVDSHVPVISFVCWRFWAFSASLIVARMPSSFPPPLDVLVLRLILGEPLVLHPDVARAVSCPRPITVGGRTGLRHCRLPLAFFLLLQFQDLLLVHLRAEALILGSPLGCRPAHE